MISVDGCSAFGVEHMVAKGWGADVAARSTAKATKAALKAKRAAPAARDATHQNWARAREKFVNMNERSHRIDQGSGEKISPMRSRTFAHIEHSFPGYGGRTGTNWEFNSGNRVRKGWKANTAAAGAGAGLAFGGVAAHNKKTTGSWKGLAGKEGLKLTVTPKKYKAARGRYLQMAEEHKAGKRKS